MRTAQDWRYAELEAAGLSNDRLRARVSAEVEARLSQGTNKLRPQDWKSGDKLWVVEVIAPFGGAEEMVKDLKAKVFPNEPIKFVVLGTGGKLEVRTA